MRAVIRRMFWKAYQRLSPKPPASVALPDTVPTLRAQEEIRNFIRSLDVPDDDARRYLEIHLERIAITLGLTPRPRKTGKVLELGAYMHMTPALQCVLGYSEVRGGTMANWGNPN